MSAYYLKQVVKEWNIGTIYRGMADFMVIQVIAVVLVIVFPQIVMWLPDALQDKPGMAAPPIPASEGQARESLEAGDTERPAAETEKP